MAGGPFRLGLLDAVLPRRHEIPPDVARAVHRCAAEQHEMGVGEGGYDDRVSGPQDEQLAGAEPIAGDFNLACDQINRALLGIGIDRLHTGADRTPVRSVRDAAGGGSDRRACVDPAGGRAEAGRVDRSGTGSGTASCGEGGQQLLSGRGGRRFRQVLYRVLTKLLWDRD